MLSLALTAAVCARVRACVRAWGAWWQGVQSVQNGWAAVSKLPMALDDHSVDEEDEIRGIGQRVAVLLG